MSEWQISLISAGAGLAGVFLGGWITARNQREKRRADFVERQLSEFYSPLVSLRVEIWARSKLRAQIQSAATSEWGRLDEEATTPEAKRQLQETRWPDFSAIIEDDNRTLSEALIPAYRQMATTFREKMWLAEPETRTHFAALTEFVEVWERYLRNALPGEVVRAIDHTEVNLCPFYSHLEETHDRLRTELALINSKRCK